MRFADGVIATFELFNVWSRRPDWVLEVRAPGMEAPEFTSGAGTEARLRITGTVAAPALPGPSELAVAYVDEPRGYTYRPVAASVRVRRVDVARVRVEGTFSVDDLTVELDVEAALVT